MAKNKKELGNWGENLAESYLAGRGISILGRNVRTKYGELDIIGACQGMTIFFEVKTRQSETFGNPEDAISSVKRSHLINSAESFLQDHPDLPDQWRIDVIAINLKRGKSPEIEWFENAVS
ncbi:MAG TPA: YraN family protein [Anaerolineaceae bacterium]|nr:YraN family protein [Anaerolineaceae bacterium]